MNIFLKIFIIFNLLLLSFISLFINDLLNIWFFMEMNNFLFISFLSFNLKSKKMIFFYFLIQIIPSILLIFYISLNFVNFMNNNNKILLLLVYSSLLIKLGLPPFHLWMPLISPHMPWNTLFLNLTIQKIIPFYLFSNIFIENYLIYFILISCSLIPPLMMMNLTNLKKLLAYSSINQSSWLMILIYLKNSLWLSYFFMYTLIYLIMFLFLSFYKFNFNFMNNNNNFKMIMLIMMLNMAGLPPFSFFLFKWFSIFLISSNFMNLFIISMLMIFSSFIMFFLYTNMIYLNMFIFILKSKMLILNYSYTNPLKVFFLLSMIILLFPLIIMI
uniref:NADH-ubiquinone oxidoreductase chain 2 n=1 Tax=Dorymyrmex brunneus TaxID=609524 RepID=A0A343YVD5_9HYME|nr:NADH dehydrogenase subunit 2 [Dorymyrmex brunneus]